MASTPRRAPSPARSGPRLVLLPVAVVVGAVVGFTTLGAHQDAVRSPTSAHSAGTSAPRHAYDVRPAMKAIDYLARRIHLSH